MRSILSQLKRVFNATNSNDSIPKSKNLFSIFSCISGIFKKFGILSKKSWVSEDYSFWNYWLRKVELVKCAKTSRVRKLMDGQHFKGSETLLKVAWQYFLLYFLITLKGNQLQKLFFRSIWNLRLFLTILPPDDKYILSVKASV